MKALRHLQAAPVVAFPAGTHDKLGVAERIITPWLSDTQTQLPLTFPYVLDPQALSRAWHLAAEAVWPYLQSGDVVFACEGDVSFYGTFTYLAQSLQLQHPEVAVKAIAGVSSPMAAAAALGIPLTCQDQRLAVLPALYSFNSSFNSSNRSSTEGIDAPDNGAANALEAALAWAEVIVLMKVSSVYSQVWKILAEHQLLEKSYVVENATRPEQKTYIGLQNYPELTLPYFSLLIVHCGEGVSVALSESS